MAIICRLIQLPPEVAAALAASSGKLEQAVAEAKLYSGVYRYWHGIEFLLAQHQPGSHAARWLTLGSEVGAAKGPVRAPRVIAPGEVVALHKELSGITPEDLVPHYDAAALDAAKIYPECWVQWEESFDPLGQVLEHYTFLQRSAKGATGNGNALLLLFEDNGDDD